MTSMPPSGASRSCTTADAAVAAPAEQHDATASRAHRQVYFPTV